VRGKKRQGVVDLKLSIKNFLCILLDQFVQSLVIFQSTQSQVNSLRYDFDLKQL
jgi:hypothetical protein